MNTIPCDIVLLPNDELAQRAIKASQSLAEYDPLFTLEIGKFYPHMSLYMFQLNVDDIPKVESVLKTMAEKFHIIGASATKYSIGEGGAIGYVDPEYAVTDELVRFQDQVIEAINPIRSGMRENDKAKMLDATGTKLENLQKYGYVSVGELFRPHITLSRLKTYVPEVVEKLPDIKTFDGTYVRLGLFEMGDNGTCVREIKTFDLL
jgi:hypothetical protein